MDLQILFSILVFFVALFYLITKFRIRYGENLPPQPWKLPLLGHLHHLSGALPHRALGNLAEKLGPIIRLQLGEIPLIVISSPVFAKDVLKTHDLSFANRPKILSAEIVGYNYKDIVFAPYGEYWRQMRKICILELLSAKKVKSFQFIREEESWKLIESVINEMQKSSTINLTKMIFTMMNAIAVKGAVGSRFKDQANLLALLKELVSVSSGFDVSDLFPSFKVLHLIMGSRNKLTKIKGKIDKIFDDIISDHEDRPASGPIDHNEDLLDVLLRLRADGGLQFPLTSDNIKAVLLDMFVGGTDTTAVTIEWAMIGLMKNPKVMKQAQAEIRQVLKGKNKIYESDIQELEYLKLVIKESLRLHPPLPFLVPRESRENRKIGGYHIPTNTKVIINAWKIGRDPNYWDDPESFMPERFKESSVNMMGTDFEFLPFGAGRRMCPGMMMGLASVELTLARLLYNFNWELPNGITPENFDMSETFGATLIRKQNLHLIPSAYNTS